MKTKRKQFYLNGSPRYFRPDTHHRRSRRGGDKIKWRYPIVYWRQISANLWEYDGQKKKNLR